jgi:hypothetical protein
MFKQIITVNAMHYTVYKRSYLTILDNFIKKNFDIFCNFRIAEQLAYCVLSNVHTLHILGSFSQDEKRFSL